MRIPGRRAALPTEVLSAADLHRGERVLARATAEDGTWLLGTRDALVLVPPLTGGVPVTRVPWERVATADWNRDEEQLRVVEVGEFGEPPPTYALTLGDPGTLLPMVRERVTASVLLTRRVPVAGRRGLTVIGRRAPRGTGEIGWAVELDEGLDPDDPRVREALAQGLRSAREELGLDPEVG